MPELDYDADIWPRISVSWMGESLGVSWLTKCPMGTDTCYKISRITPEGEVLAEEMTTIQGLMTIKWNNNILASSWVDLTGVHYSTWNRDLTRETGNVDLVGSTHLTQGITPSMDWSGSDYVITWHQVDSPPPYSRVNFARIKENGEFNIDSTYIEELGSSSQPQLAYSSASIGFVYFDNDNDMLFANIASNGELLDEPIPVSYGQVSQDRIIWTGSEFMLFWVEGPINRSSLVFAAINNGRLTEKNYLSSNTNGLLDPQVVWTGSSIGVVWVEAKDDDTQCFDRIDDRSGTTHCKLAVYCNILTRP